MPLAIRPAVNDHNDRETARGLIRLPGATFFRYPRNGMVNLQTDMGDWFFYLEEGLVKLSVFSTAGDERIISFATAGQIFGEHAAVLHVPYGVTATAVTESLIYRIPRLSVLAHIETHPRLALYLNASLARKLVLLGRQLAHASSRDVYGRVASTLYDLSRTVPAAGSPGGPLELSITHQQLANFIGCNRVTITNALAYLEEEGLIQKSHRRIIVPDVARLRRWVEHRTAD